MITMGYRGDAVLQQKFVDDPFKVVASSTIYLSSDEVNFALDQTNWPDWNMLNSQQKRQLARGILINRGDRDSYLQAEQLSLNTPAYNSFVIIKSEPVVSPVDQILNSFLI